MEHAAMTLMYYLEILNRRKWSLLCTALTIIALAATAAWLLPSLYRSEATIYIEEQEISSDFVGSTTTSAVEQRIQTIHQRVMSFKSLAEVIRRHDPYPELSKALPLEQQIAMIQASTSLSPVSTAIVDRRTRRPSTATTAFVLGYTDRDPRRAQKMATLLAELALAENQKSRVQQVEQTSAFLETELERIKEELILLDAKISAFQQKHINELPEILAVNVQSLNTGERDLSEAHQQLKALREREEYLKSQLDALNPNIENESRKRLEELKVQLAALTKSFTDEYPDVKQTRNEIQMLERALSYVSPHGALPNNPAYITLNAQLAGVRADIASMQNKIARLDKVAQEYRQRVARAPAVSDAYNDLIRERKNVQTKYDELISKLMDARVAQGLEKEQKGERFNMVEAPRLPLMPFKPNRKAIVFMGIVMGIAAGIGMASLREFLDDRIHNMGTIQRTVGCAVLGAIPVIVTARERTRRGRRRIMAVAGLLVGCALVLALFYREQWTPYLFGM
jgi:polysaccharide chain length determinant protein (PEP-CTERM system associated)